MEMKLAQKIKAFNSVAFLIYVEKNTYNVYNMCIKWLVREVDHADKT